MKANANKAKVACYNGFLVHITRKCPRNSWHHALVTYATIKNSRSFVFGEVAEEGDSCYRLAVKKAKSAGTIQLWVYRALANVLKKKDLKPKEAYVVECVDPEKPARKRWKSRIPCAQAWIYNFVSSW